MGCQPVARIPVSRSLRGQPAGTRGTAGDVSAGVPGGQRSLARLERGSRGLLLPRGEAGASQRALPLAPRGFHS